MELLLLLSLLLLPLLATANDTSIAKLVALTKAGNGLAPLNDKLYDEIFSAPRNFSLTLVLTALGSQFQCQPCQTFDTEYQLLARQWIKQPQHIRNSHFFAMLDFKEGKNTFAKLGLNTAPQARLYLSNHDSSIDPKKLTISYDFNKGGPKGLTAELFTDWVIEHASLPKFFKRPPNYGKIFAVGCVFLAIVILVKVAWPIVRLVISSRFIWAATLLPVILLMISGQMWCQIRSPPYMVKGPTGNPSYIAGGYSNQYGVETQLIASLYGILAFAAYTLAFTVSKLDDPFRQRVAVYVWLGVYLTISSMLLNIFRLKNGSYPFKLFL
ncbi:hypothetical protein KEM48_006682 [Puccinia striiformis f. sp. tritici PST-130]|uniref:Uncharacterized protein n=1 Tax=Puccinia striiformis f. sp. tritici PST-78 TaxID=1165861 RepID=A0A0L0W141_9BASI|nr:hypothetical protein Pst134EB_020370 [Puccinia striiformis f. sp. tritici]KAI9599756.1 hypothetical protein KEM48_006682 [Puccinia striiformis f. sp. tritici PST-130]KNF05224.1 hypothetical protein PSTG_01443 [Puccinia striiformis f. sp. tritici PST-78]